MMNIGRTAAATPDAQQERVARLEAELERTQAALDLAVGRFNRFSVKLRQELGGITTAAQIITALQRSLQ